MVRLAKIRVGVGNFDGQVNNVATARRTGEGLKPTLIKRAAVLTWLLEAG